MNLTLVMYRTKTQVHVLKRRTNLALVNVQFVSQLGYYILNTIKANSDHEMVGSNLFSLKSY